MRHIVFVLAAVESADICAGVDTDDVRGQCRHRSVGLGDERRGWLTVHETTRTPGGRAARQSPSRRVPGDAGTSTHRAARRHGGRCAVKLEFHGSSFHRHMLVASILVTSA